MNQTCGKTGSIRLNLPPRPPKKHGALNKAEVVWPQIKKGLLSKDDAVVKLIKWLLNKVIAKRSLFGVLDQFNNQK